MAVVHFQLPSNGVLCGLFNSATKTAQVKVFVFFCFVFFWTNEVKTLRHTLYVFDHLVYRISEHVSVFSGSPWSASEPSIEPEGPGSTSGVDDYHRNMSWLHVSSHALICVCE